MNIHLYSNTKLYNILLGRNYADLFLAQILIQ